MATEVIEPPEDAVEDRPGTEPSAAKAAPPPDTAWVEALQADTPAEEIHKRALTKKDGTPVMRDGNPVELSYVTARYVQDRLDAAVGPANWRNEFESLPSGAVRCGIGIRIPENSPVGLDRWVTKWDVGVPSLIEPDKGAHSDAFKRAGVQWGIARDLYEERDEDQPTQQVAGGTVRAAVAGQTEDLRTRQAREAAAAAAPAQYAEDGQVGPDPEPEWVCPVHDDSKVVPAGISKRTGRPYNAFYACPVAGCDQKGNSVGGRR